MINGRFPTCYPLKGDPVQKIASGLPGVPVAPFSLSGVKINKIRTHIPAKV
jgi:hypothetical protein